jgi:uncharacterized ferritin-like protein (DUF455 family)
MINTPNNHAQSLRLMAYEALTVTDPVSKYHAVKHIVDCYLQEESLIDPLETIVSIEDLIPGRPNQPILVNPISVKKRSMHTIQGRAVAIHALAHIEFNAINLALDAVWRFADMPKDYYLDWIKVADEEATHFLLLKNYLNKLQYDYGNFPAHDSVWEMVEKTKGDILARMALVPRTMEARGLDAVPAMRARFLQVKDHHMVEILDRILHDEIGHVEIGNRWFNFICKSRELDPLKTFQELSIQFNAPTLRGPFNITARKQAGFTDAELELLQGGQ